MFLNVCVTLLLILISNVGSDVIILSGIVQPSCNASLITCGFECQVNHQLSIF